MSNKTTVATNVDTDNQDQSTQIKGTTDMRTVKRNKAQQAIADDKLAVKREEFRTKLSNTSIGNGITSKDMVDSITNFSPIAIERNGSHFAIYKLLVESKHFEKTVDVVQKFIKTLSGKESFNTVIGVTGSILETTKWGKFVGTSTNTTPQEFRHACITIMANALVQMSVEYKAKGTRNCIVSTVNYTSSQGLKYSQVQVQFKHFDGFDPSKDLLVGMFEEEPEVLSRTKVKRGMIPQKLSAETAKSIEYFQMDSARIELAVNKEVTNFIATHSGEATAGIKYETYSAFMNKVVRNRKEIADTVEKIYPELTKAHTNQMVCDLVARMYTSNNKLSWMNPQAKGKLNYQSVAKQVINADGGLRVAHFLAWVHSDEDTKTAKGYDNYIKENGGIDAIRDDLEEVKAPTELDLQNAPELLYVMPSALEIEAEAMENTQTLEFIRNLYPAKSEADIVSLYKRGLDEERYNTKTKYYDLERKHRVDTIAKRGTAMSEHEYMRRGLQAYTDFLNGTLSSFILLKDFAASGIIWWSVILKLPKLARYANLLESTDIESYRDPYEAIAIDLIAKLGGTLTPALAKSMRKAIKSTLQAILHGGAFGPAARDFSKLNLLGRDITTKEMINAFKSLFGANILLIRELTEFSQGLVTERRPFNSWLSLDGTKCLNRFAGAKRSYKVWYANPDNASGVASVTLVERTHFKIDPATGKPAKTNVETLDIYGQKVVEEAKMNGFAANFLHSIDAFVARMIASTLQGRLYIFVHDNYGVHPNDVHLVEKATRNAIKMIARLNFLQRAVDSMVKEANEGFQKEANFSVREKALKEFKAECLTKEVKFKIANFNETSYPQQPCKNVDSWDLQLGTLFKEIPLTEEFPYLQY